MRLLAIGMFVFELSTLAFDQLQRKTDWKHARSDRVGTMAATQYVGPGDETVTLSGSVYAEIADGRVSLADLEAMAAQGDAWPVVDGTGRVYGHFVITALDERHASLMADGRARRIDFGIDLLRVEDPATVQDAAFA
ncbi:phage tail protein [Sphingobium cloacae]|uniref:Phage P2 GpU family protein n=1 Tax=Sphingobium cloacae TaxID=120107 RepID=A0A1E1F5G0_9SPHN|nr:phage tail protein [Sphingobium cloacae]BAV65748.1 phage P2 GpU family protein [Sphingobium cloacae]